MPSKYDPNNINIIRDMRMIEKALSELHTRIRIYASQYEQSQNRVEALKIQYAGLSLPNPNLIDEEPEYHRAIEKMNTARRQLDRLEKERDRLKKVLQDNMHRF